MEFLKPSIKNIKRVLVVMIVFTVVCSTSSSSDRQSSRFSRENFGSGKDQEFVERSSRVKRQSRPCPFAPINCSTIPNVNRFRTIDGTCNNIAKPYCGASDIVFVRHLPRDPPGHAFRCPTCPRPRDVSFTITNVMPADHNDGITLMVMQWGQLTDHDLVFTPEDSEPECCADFLTATETNSCKPIDVTNDPFYSSLSRPVNCLQFLRSTAAVCGVGTDRENINERTAYLDGSTVYGSTLTISNSLRTFSGGQLKTGPGSEGLPCSGAANVCPRSFLPNRTGTDGQQEFFAGDTRVEEQPGLTSLHTLFVRFHNLLASELVCNLPSDEKLFQETRRIVGAVIQQITYNEFLPIVLGPYYMNDYGLTLKPATGPSNTFNNGYDPAICASAPTVFATAAFRFGHSLIPDQYNTINGPVLLERNFENHDVTLNPNSLPSHFIDAIILQSAMPMDQKLVQAITNKLFAQGPSFEFGSDLFARNIQRGRDHGIPGYVKFFNFCYPNLQITSFDDLYDLMPSDVVDAFKILYGNNMDNIDLFPAGIAEFEVDGGLVGPTFACIIAKHFRNLKYGDRFWFEREGVFTLSQVQSLRRTRLASLICAFTAVDESRFEVMIEAGLFFPCSDILQFGVLNDVLSTNIWDCGI